MATVERKTGGGIGEAVLRKEDRKFVTGEGRYVDDLRLPGMLHAVFVRSPFGHAKVKGIDTAAAEALPGVHRVLTHATLPAETGVLSASNPPGSDVRQPEQPLLARDEVRYVGEPVAIVIADDRYIARDGADLVLVDYDPLPVVCDAEAALADGAPLVHSEYPDNAAATLVHETEGFEAAMQGAARTVELRVVNQRVTPMPMETRGCIGDWQQATGEVTLYTSTQVAHFVRTFISFVCGTSEAKVRVVTPDVGGGFGAKLNTYREEFAVCSASRVMGVPVKWIEDRSENAVATIHGRDQVQYYTAGVDESGRIVALKFDAIQNNGAYHQLLTPTISHLTVFMVPGCYDIQNISIRMRQAFTNTTPTDAYRGAGRPEATYAIEVAMDALARKMKIDPFELRQRNFIKREQFFDAKGNQTGYTAFHGLNYDSGDHLAAAQKATKIVDYAGVRKKQAQQNVPGARKRLGIGMTSYFEMCGLAPSRVLASLNYGAGGWESATVRVLPTSKVQVVTGTSPHGQGHETSWAMIAAEKLGVAPEDVDVLHSDTAIAPLGLDTYGSRSLAVGGVAIAGACDKVIDKARLIAAHQMECAAEDLQFDKGVFSVKGSPEKAVPIAAIAFAAFTAHNLPDGVEPNLEAQYTHDPKNFSWPFGTHVCVVEVDTETGKVDVLKYVAVDDCGNQVNPLIVEGQVHGGVVQGLAQALYEEAVYDSDGNLKTTNLAEYLVPAACDVPPITTDFTVTPSPTNELGVKGIGEAGTIGAASTVMNAVIDALSGLGVTKLDMPASPNNVWKAINAAQGGKQ